jgi:hypothetical protein
MLRAGTYYLPATLTFTASDSGSTNSPVIYQNYPGETPVISGGKPITGWTNISGNTWTVGLSSGAYQNFEALFYNGERRLRPRTTPNNPCSSFPCSSYLYNTGPVIASSQSTNCQVQVTNGWQCYDQFIFNGSDVASTYHGIGLGDVEVLDFEKWTTSRMRLASVDAANHIAYLSGPTYQGTDNGFIAGHRYLIENIKESLNQPGQWYLDRCPDNSATCATGTPEGTWTLTYLAQSGENPSTATIVVPQLSQLVTATGLHDVVFRGLTFSDDDWLPSSAGLGEQQGSPNVSAGISLSDTQNVVFDSVTIAHTEGWGIEFFGSGNGISSSNQVINSSLYDLGAGGVRIGRWPCKGAGQEIAACTTNDQDSTVTQYTLVQNNVIEGGGRVQPTGIGTGVWVGNAHNNVIDHNEIYDFYSGAIGVGFTYGESHGYGFAHDNTVTFNRVYQLGQGVTSDMGGIYFATSVNTGNLMMNNVMHDITHNWLDPDGYGGNGLYLDQGTSQAVALNNVVYRTSSTSLFNNRSDALNDTYTQNNVIRNNILAYSRGVVFQRGGDNPYSFAAVHNVIYYDRGAIQGGHWTCADVGKTGAAVPCTTRFLLDYNVYWNTAGQAPQFETTSPGSTNSMSTYNLSQWQGQGEDTHSINQNPALTSPGYPSDNFDLSSSSPAYSAGFLQFDPSQAGVTNPTTLPSVPASFPLELLNPATDY